MKRGKKKDDGYYCGSETMPICFRKILSIPFNQSCKLHDEQYLPETKTPKLKADWIFLRNMQKQAGFNLFYQFLAIIYFLMVIIFGWARYKEDNP